MSLLSGGFVWPRDCLYQTVRIPRVKPIGGIGDFLLLLFWVWELAAHLEQEEDRMWFLSSGIRVRMIRALCRGTLLSDGWDLGLSR